MLERSGHRALHLLLGVLSVVVAVIVLVFPGIGIALLVVLLAVGLLVLGFVGISLGLFGLRFSVAARLVSLIAGVIAVVFSLAALLDPGLGTRTLLFLLFVALAIYGIGGIAYGSVRRTPSWVRGWLLALGVLDLVLAVVVLVVPALGLLFLVALLAVVLLLNGIKEIATGLGGHRSLRRGSGSLVW